MTEDELHPTDVAAMRDSASHGGPLRQELSNAIVALFKQYHGRGPADCRTYLEPDLVVVVMTGGYHAAEQTLFEAGKWIEVRQARLSWQDTMHARFVDTIEPADPSRGQGVHERQPPGARRHGRGVRARARGDRPRFLVMALLWRSWSTRSTIDRWLQLQPLSSPGCLRVAAWGPAGVAEPEMVGLDWPLHP